MGVVALCHQVASVARKAAKDVGFKHFNNQGTFGQVWAPVLTYVYESHGIYDGIYGVHSLGILGDEKNHKYPRDIGLI